MQSHCCSSFGGSPAGATSISLSAASIVLAATSDFWQLHGCEALRCCFVSFGCSAATIAAASLPDIAARAALSPALRGGASSPASVGTTFVARLRQRLGHHVQ